MRYKLRGNFSTEPFEGLVQILKNRGVEDVDAFLSPSLNDELDYMNLDNIKDGIEMLLNHLNDNIGVVVDSDVDGITSSSIIMLYIKKLNPNVNIKYFCHEGKKHGIDDMVDVLEDENIDLLIVPDAGSNDIEYMKILTDSGMDILILDHHEFEYKYEDLPENVVLINVACSDRYTNKNLSGAGVVYKFCEALDDSMGVKFANEFADIMALGEIADQMSKNTSETNYLMNLGVSNVRNGCIAALIEKRKDKLGEKAFYPYNGLTTEDFGFYLAPMLNAIVRVGTKEENERVVEAFLNSDKIVASTKKGSFGEMEKISEQIARLGTNCQSRQNRIKEKAIDYIDFKIQDEGLYNDNIIIVRLNHDEVDFPNTITGLVAINFVKKYGKPVLIGWEDPDMKNLKGSIRGSENFEKLPDLKNYLMSSGYFESVLGHSNAAGFSIPIKNINKFTDYANKNLDVHSFDNCHIVDYEFNAEDYDLYSLAFNMAKRKDLFGSGVDGVKFVIKNLPTAGIIEMGAKKTTAKITYNNVDYLKYTDEEFINTAKNCDYIDIICDFSLNYWHGKCTLQASIIDYSQSQSKYDF